jgi:hypothetical protein
MLEEILDTTRTILRQQETPSPGFPFAPPFGNPSFVMNVPTGFSGAAKGVQPRIFEPGARKSTPCG